MPKIKLKTSQILENFKFFATLVGTDNIVNCLKDRNIDTLKHFNKLLGYGLSELYLITLCPYTFLQIKGADAVINLLENSTELVNFVTKPMLEIPKIFDAYKAMCNRLNQEPNLNFVYTISVCNITANFISRQLDAQIIAFLKSFEQTFVFNELCYFLDEHSARLAIGITREKFANELRIYKNFYNTTRFGSFSIKFAGCGVDDMEIEFTLYNGTVFNVTCAIPDASKIDTIEKIEKFYIDLMKPAN